MSDQQQPLTGGEALDKAKEYAKDNPDQARSAIDKIEDAVDARTGGKFSELVDKAGDFVEGRLGVPRETSAEPADAPAETPGDTPAETPADTSAEAPAESPADTPPDEGDGGSFQIPSGGASS